jgi:hypothetical protein
VKSDRQARTLTWQAKRPAPPKTGTAALDHCSGSAGGGVHAVAGQRRYPVTLPPRQPHFGGSPCSMDASTVFVSTALWE